MSESDNNTGKAALITQKKIDNMYGILLLYKTPSLCAQALGVSPATLSLWLKTGAQLLEEHVDLACELSDIKLDCLKEVQEIMEENEITLEATFCEKNRCESISVKNLARYNEYVMRETNKLLESLVAPKENEVINNFVFSDKPILNDNYKKYVCMYRAFIRADLAMKGENLSHITNHASTSKNVNLAKWLLECTETSFRPQKIEHKVVHEGSVSLLDIQLAKEKEIQRRENTQEPTE